MVEARYSIGIDLGTTNSALAYVPLQGDAPSEVFSVLQWDTLTSVAEATTLPSFLYLPEEAVATQLQGFRAGAGEWIAGRLARRRATETPDRVVHSAKSWLVHHGADRTAAFLPWGSEDIAQERKISPIRASALILNALRGAWDDRFAASGAEFLFDAQEITIAVPASFDAVAQRLTLDAARDAGFPATTRLLEEPQAAFYDWLEQRDADRDLWQLLPGHAARSAHVLVVDIGGGTADFSLFQLRPAIATPDNGARISINRVAVSDHILLGGDNLDLALARLIEPRLAGEEERLSGPQWSHLVARCRDLKEQALTSDDPVETVYTLSIPGRGSRLISGSQSAQVSRGEIDAILFDGFFPLCAAGDRPHRTQTALKEWGLPFASDGRITRYLAEFLDGRPRVDAVLFNGGTLYPTALQHRLRTAIASWQGDDAPLILDNGAPDLAVARGAARFGKLRVRKAERINASTARAIYLAVHRESEASDDADANPTLVCVLPKGAVPEETFTLADLALDLRVDRPVRFQIYASSRHRRVDAGSLTPWNACEFQPLPPVETIVKGVSAKQSASEQTVPVVLTAKINNLGLLQLACVSTDPARPHTWPLEFNLRPNEFRGSAITVSNETTTTANVEPRVLKAAEETLTSAFARTYQRDKLSAIRLFKSLEASLHLPRNEWNWMLLRALWPALRQTMPYRANSADHEETWLIVAGFLLRPGFGAPLDDQRIDELWMLREVGLALPTKRSKLQEHILWRRVAGGLSGKRQEQILTAELPKIREGHKLPPELVYLAGSLERLSHPTKADLIRVFTTQVLQLAREKQHCAPYLTALGLLLNRSPLYAGPEAVVSPDLAEYTYEALSDLDWSERDLIDIQMLFLRAARVVDNRSLDLAKTLRNRIARRLEKAGVPSLRTARLREFMPIERGERLGLFGEALPPGLLLRDNSER